ncbi:MAG: TerB family tellurite resistance protein [Chryseobacterium sp.]|nr:MAG: TerB family tellurite resistance protein [Chryseobacterium sp.]
MKTRFLIWAIGILVGISTFSSNTYAQSTEVEQLLLNVEKLSQLKNILSDMKKGYQVVSNGYSAVKNIAQGNFSIHEVFIDGMMLVSPEVRNYRRIAEIISAQGDLVKEYKAALKSFNGSALFNPSEINYISSVYSSLFSQSMDNLDELTMILTASMLRMNDEERLTGIDRIFEDTQDKISFLRSFNREAGLLLLQRKHARSEMEEMNSLFKGN